MAIQIFNSIVIILTILVQAVVCTQGNISYKAAIIVNGNGSDSLQCCKGGCECSSLSSALHNLGNDMMISITSDAVALNSVVKLKDLKRIRITGHEGNRTNVTCDNNGGLSCEHCSDVVIENIVWSNCGSAGTVELQGGVYLWNNPHNIQISNCTFQFSVHWGLLVTNASGNLIVEKSEFSSNMPSNTDGGGMMIAGAPKEVLLHPSQLHIFFYGVMFTNNGKSSSVVDGNSLHVNVVDASTIVVENSKFTYNKGGNGSIVYFNVIAFKTAHAHVLFNNTWFHDNAMESSIVVKIYFTNIHLAKHSMLQFSGSKFTNNIGTCVLSCQTHKNQISVELESTIFSHNSGSTLFGTVNFPVNAINSSISIRNTKFIDNDILALHIAVNSQKTQILFDDVMIMGGSNTDTQYNGVYIDTEYACILNMNKLSLQNLKVFHYGLYVEGLVDSLTLSNSFVINSVGSVNIVYFNVKTATADGFFSFHVTKCYFSHNILTTDRTIGIVSILGEITGYMILESLNFTNNSGSALYISKSQVDMRGTSYFRDNQGIRGGAIYFDDALVIWRSPILHFYNNKATLYGGAIFVKIVEFYSSFFSYVSPNIDLSNISFIDNSAAVGGKSWYFNIPSGYPLNTSSSDKNSVLYYLSQFNYGSSNYTEQISTSPYDLLFTPNSTRCVDSTSTTRCGSYIVKNIMLGQALNVPAKVVNYFNIPAGFMQFYVTCVNCSGYYITGHNPVLISEAFQGVAIVGKDVVSSNTNVTLLLKSFFNAEAKVVSVNLTVELATCIPGFKYYSESGLQTCMCYNSKENVIVCSSDTSAEIKKGYWIGNVKNKTTTTFCPKKYCTFTHCNTINYCTLPLKYDGQCRKNRCGPACGSCKPNHVLSFDSDVCVNENQCSTRKTALLLILSFMYWILVVAVIIILTNFNFQVGLGYAYGIVYFYSVIDILIEENMLVTGGLFRFVTIFSSFAKLTPQFLGTLCLIKSSQWSGIDQQFFHYVHPIAILFILLLIILVARYSPRVSMLIGRSIIRAICLILLLAYTSIASTSLELLRPLIFHHVQGVYTYSSPHLPYFQCRHILYGCFAIVCEIVIVIGLPLLLILEPFISYKVDFARIRPLLDQYQGCFKDNRRTFAAFYLLCRLAIITMVYTENRNYYNRLFMLNIVCIIIAMVHTSVLPYKNGNLNTLDGIILLTVVLIVNVNTVLSYTTFASSNTELVIVLVIVPLIAFTGFVLVSVYNKYLCCKQDNELNAVDYDALFDEDDRNDDRIEDELSTRVAVNTSERSTSYHTFQESLLDTHNTAETEDN
ncbi:uncharacterized protein [Dysidea avara]|uniref:uncharacterized protein isoform X2 n=1 Tax=Dysidea avara TaxID=196820 RepID=UPI0033197F30